MRSAKAHRSVENRDRVVLAASGELFSPAQSLLIFLVGWINRSVVEKRPSREKSTMHHCRVNQSNFTIPKLIQELNQFGWGIQDGEAVRHHDPVELAALAKFLNDSPILSADPRPLDFSSISQFLSCAKRTDQILFAFVAFT